MDVKLRVEELRVDDTANELKVLKSIHFHFYTFEKNIKGNDRRKLT